MQQPRVFYGDIKDEPEARPPGRRRASPADGESSGGGSGSEAETELDEVQTRKFKRLHRRTDSVDAVDAERAARKRPRATARPPARPRVSSREARDANGRTPLQKAADRGDAARVRELVDAGANVNDRDYAGTAVLHSAALSGSAEVVRYLLDHGALVDVRSGADELDTPLIDAVSNGNVDIVRLLLDHGADPQVSNAAGETALDFLDEDLSESEEIAQLLKEGTARARKRGPPVVDPAKAPRGTFPPAMTAEEDDAARRGARGGDEELEAGGDRRGRRDAAPGGVGAGAGGRSRRGRADLFVDLSTKAGRQQVVRGAGAGDLQYIGMALEHGWQPTAEALVLAAKHGHTDVVGLLLAYGTGADALYDGVTALHETLGRGHAATVELLLDSGADVHWRDADGRSYVDLVADLRPDDAERRLIYSRSGVKDEADKADEEAEEAEIEVNAAAVKLNEGAAPSDAEADADARTKTEAREPSPVPDEPASTAVKDEADATSALTPIAEESEEEPLAAPPAESVVGGGKDATPEPDSKPQPESQVADASKKAETPLAEPAEPAARAGPAVTPAEPAKPKPSRHITWDDQVRSGTGASTSVSAATSAAPTAAATAAAGAAAAVLPRRSPSPDPQSAEMARKLEELAARRERERKAREARMLEALAQQEQRDAARRQGDASAGDAPARVATPPLPHDTERAVSETPASPLGPIRTASPAPGAPGVAPGSPGIGAAPASAGAALSAPEAKRVLAGLPHALRELARHGQPQPQVLPLLALRVPAPTAGAGAGAPALPPTFAQDPGSFRVLDVQVALLLGAARLHEQHPTLQHMPVSAAEKAQLWGLVRPWLAGAVEDGAAAAAAERARYDALALSWLRGDEVVALVSAAGVASLHAVPISLGAAPGEPSPGPGHGASQTSLGWPGAGGFAASASAALAAPAALPPAHDALLELAARQLPLRFALKLRQRELSAWDY